MENKKLNRFKLFEKFDIAGSKKFPVKPDVCPHCLCTDIHGIEILGAYDGDLMWECTDCRIRLLKFSSKKTLELLRKTEELYYDMENRQNYYA